MHTTDADPRSVYERRLAARRAELSAQQSVDRRLSFLRLLVFLGGAVVAWPVVMTRTLPWTWMIAPALAFVAIAVAHDRVIRKRAAARRAVAFYEAGLARLTDRWAGHGVQGSEYLDPEHPYADDLDLFGSGSLFELLCTARTRSGERTLARWLLEPASPDEVRLRQEALSELRPALDLREDLARLGEDVRDDDDPDALTAWASAEPVLAARWPAWLAMTLAAGNIAALGGWLSGATGRWPLLLAAAAGASFALGLRSRVKKVLAGVSRPGQELELLAGVLARVERERFQAPWLRSLQASLDADGPPPSRRIARLARLIELNDSRRNMIFAPFATLLLLGTQLALALERWRAASGAAVGQWLDGVGRLEALCAFATLGFERPDDVFPEIVEGPPLFAGEGLGHPLIPDTHCVRNDVTLDGSLKLLMVSGSNMSGKSTLLRTVGVLALLAQAGAPVRARRLRLVPLAIGACIHVRDSLQHGTSHFYAEIQRVRRIVDLGAGPVPLLFLLDEIFHGTNSHDRRIGAEAVVGGLLERGGVGLVTTHDLALAEIAEAQGPRAANVHFVDRIADGRIVFDYRLRPGVVRKSNALELMRSVGLDV